MDERHLIAEDRFVELRIWRVPRPVRASDHLYKFSLAFVVKGICVLRYDNEAGKGSHVHRGHKEADYKFVTPEKLLEDFWSDVEGWEEP